MKDLTKGKEWKLILYFTLPMLLGNIFQQLYNIIDSIIVGIYIGKEALAAVGASFPIIFILISFIIGVSSGSTVIIGQYYGAKNFQSCKRAIDTLMIFTFFASIIVSIIGLVLSRYVFVIMKLPEEIIPNAIIFFRIYCGGMVLLFGFNGMAAILRGLGDSKTPLYFLALSTIINIILVILFVKYYHWGIKGSAYATVIAQGFSFFLFIFYINWKKKIFYKISLNNMIWDKSIFIRCLKIGLPTGFQQMLVALGMIAIFRIVNEFGTNVIAGYTAASRIDSFATLPAMNIGIALSAFVAQNIGAHNLKRVKKGVKATLIMSSIFSIFATLISIIFGSYIMSWFTHDKEVINVGHSYLIIVSLFYIAFSAMFTYNGALRGAGATFIPMILTFCSLWLIRIPFSYFLSIYYGYQGIWWGVSIGLISGLIMTYVYYRFSKWGNKIY